MPRILIASTVLPWPLHRNGGAQRTTLLRRALNALGADVDVLAVVPHAAVQLPGDRDLRDHGVVAAFTADLRIPDRSRFESWLGPAGGLLHLRRQWRARYAPQPDVAVWLAARQHDYDAIFVRYLQTALLCGLDRRHPAASPPVHVDLDDIDWLTLAGRFEHEPWPGLRGRIGMAVALREVRRCRGALPAFNRLFVASEEDAAVLAAEEGVSTDVLPNIPFAMNDDPGRLAPVPPPLPASRNVLFVGDLEFGPNTTGLDRFLDRSWPAVRAQVPEVTLTVVGRGLTELQRQRWSAHAGVEVLGYVEDLRSVYARCACTIAPTWWGGGTKIKVVESAALGRPCVATRHALRGYRALADSDPPAVLLAEDDAELAGRVVMLLQDPRRRTLMASAGPVVAHQSYSFSRLVSVLARASVTSAPGAAGESWAAARLT